MVTASSATLAFLRSPVFSECLMNVLIAFTAGVLMLMATHVGAQSLKIGYVNGLRIENESAIAKQAVEQLKKEFAPRDAQLQELQKQGAELKNELEKEGLTMQPADKQAKEKRLVALGQQFQQMQHLMKKFSQQKMPDLKGLFK